MLIGAAASLLLAVPAAQAEDVQPAAESPIQAESGQVLAETVHPQQTAESEETCSQPELFNPLTAFKDNRDYFVAPAGDFEETPNEARAKHDGDHAGAAAGAGAGPGASPRPRRSW